MLSIEPSSKVHHANLGYVNAPLGGLPDGAFSTPKSPKFNELLARHHACQEQEIDSGFSSRDKGKISSN